MKDLIERQKAIDALESIRHGLWLIDIPHPNCPEYVEHHEQITDMMQIADKCIKEISDMPTAQPERKTGMWIDTEENHGFDDEIREKAVACSAYHVAFKKSDYITEDFRYCPNCGADMRGEE